MTTDKNLSPMCQQMSDMVRHAQETIVSGLQKFEDHPFKTDLWERPGGGGGITKIIEDGSLFEKGGVNTSEVQGTITEKEMIVFLCP